jgi:hypothetical protein
VVLFKPLPDGVEDSAMFKHAPLILRETPASPLAVVIKTNAGAVLFSGRTIQINRHPHQQFTYYWFCEDTDSNPASNRPLQAMRMTLDSNGSPVIYEILADDTGAQVIFASDSVEAEAAREFGKPLPDRRFSIEQDSNEAANTIVARVIADPPIPMGPIIYQRAGSHAVQTLICRCMPAQAARVVGQNYFKLTPIKSDAERLLVSNARTTLGKSAVESWFAPDRLEWQLRLPENF